VQKPTFYEILILFLVEWHQGQDPKLVQTGRIPCEGSPTAVAISPAGDVVAVAADESIFLYFAETGELDATLPDVYNGR